MRIHKAMAVMGFSSRRRGERLIEEGRVTVNGRPARIGQDVDPKRDVLRVDGKIIAPASLQRTYIALYKPRGWVSTLSDELGRKCVADLTAELGRRVYPVGRLDKDSEGLLLMTDDGDFANLVTHPSSKIAKTYRVTVHSDVTQEALIALTTGVELDDGEKTAPARVGVLVRQPGRCVLRITICEGKNRQIRRMCQAVGLEVVRLKRIAIGPLRLGMLAPGEFRQLSKAEVKAIKNCAAGKSFDGEREEAQEGLETKKQRSSSAKKNPKRIKKR